MNRKKKFIVCFLCAMLFFVRESYSEFFYKFYADAVKANLTGLSTYSNMRFGYIFENNIAISGFIKYEWADTTGANLPFQYRYQGLTSGIEVSYSFYDERLRAIIGYGFGLTEDVEGKDDFRAGIIGYNSFEKGVFFGDLYGELIWSGRADDIFLNLRYRPGRTLLLDKNTRIWVYGAAQLYASGKGENGTENRIEVGPGIGCILAKGHLSANLDLRFGHSFRGNIKDKTYINPLIVLAVSF